MNPPHADRFTQRGLQAFKMAQEEARRIGDPYIGTEHLLLGLLRVPDSPALEILRDLGVEQDALRARIEELMPPSDREIAGAPGLTPRTKKAIELGVAEARRMGHSYCGTEHLLLGLIAEGEGIAAGVLGSFGVNLERARLATLGVLGQAKAAAAESTGPRNNVVTCRLDDRALSALDALVEAGIRPTRSDAAAWLIGAGIESHRALFDRVDETIKEIRRLRLAAQQMAQEAASPPTPAEPDANDHPPPPAN